jgi:transcription elongation factor GreA
MEENVDRREVPDGRPPATCLVRLSSRVTLSSSGGLETYQVVPAGEAEPLMGRISEASPLGRALLGHLSGDVVRWRSPGGANAALITNVA